MDSDNSSELSELRDSTSPSPPPGRAADNDTTRPTAWPRPRRRRKRETSAKRADRYLKMLAADGWSLARLVQQTVAHNKRSGAAFIKEISRPDKPKVFDRLLDYDGGVACRRHGYWSLNTLRDDLDRLPEVPGFGVFEPSKPILSLDPRQLVADVKEKVPDLLQFATLLVSVPRSRAEPPPLDQQKLLGLLAMMSYAHRPRISTNIPVILGVHLHTIGTHGRIIDLLHHLGFCPSPRTLRETAKGISNAAGDNDRNLGQVPDSVTGDDSFEQTTEVDVQASKVLEERVAAAASPDLVIRNDRVWKQWTPRIAG
ncbi:MAG: hypothetical protein M4579_002271 [Chaenotheca gracillima]|nr:MAG: hypothetical protein M4579_002271 [Chaenotheca gracillima]